MMSALPAMLAAVMFGLGAPLSKRLLGTVSPLQLAGLLYLGADLRGTDTSHRDLTAESPGLYAMAPGFQATSKDDFENMARQFPAYDALYASCRQHEPARSSGPRGSREPSRTMPACRRPGP